MVFKVFFETDFKGLVAVSYCCHHGNSRGLVDNLYELPEKTS